MSFGQELLLEAFWMLQGISVINILAWQPNLDEYEASCLPLPLKVETLTL
jgi:hypothetical protein